MHWVEQKTDTRVTYVPDDEHAKEFEKGKDESLPVLQREAVRGEMSFDPVQFRPVKSPGIYEAEFASKDKDLIFHFWPYGFHQAQRDRRAAPHFKASFEKRLPDVMFSVFHSARTEMSYDKDMGAWFVRVPNWGEHQFMSELAIQACEKLHKALGGA